MNRREYLTVMGTAAAAPGRPTSGTGDRREDVMRLPDDRPEMFYLLLQSAKGAETGDEAVEDMRPRIDHVGREEHIRRAADGVYDPDEVERRAVKAYFEVRQGGVASPVVGCDPVVTRLRD